MMIRVLMVLGLILLLAACGTDEASKDPESEPTNGQANEQPEKPSEGNGIVAGQMELNVLSFEEDKVIIELKNQMERPQVMEFTSGQQYDMWIRDENGKEVFHWGEGKMFTQAMKTETIEPGGSKAFTVALPKLDPGTYKIRFKVTSKPPFETTFKQTIE